MTKNKSKPLALLLVSLSWAGFTQAQESVNASGGDATGIGGEVAYSIGQTFFTTYSASTGTVAQGVQHAFEIYTLDIEEIALDISIVLFPNPTTENVTLQIRDYNNEKLSYQLFDVLGRLLASQQIVGQQTQIQMKGLQSATYFVNVVNQENKKVQSFKIIKK